jgi:hypothetical protein
MTDLPRGALTYQRHDQNLSGQLDALKAADATNIYREKVSGARAAKVTGPGRGHSKK